MTNSELVKILLDRLNLKHTVASPPGDEGDGVEVYSVAFNDTDFDSKWYLIIFTHRDQSILRFYSYIQGFEDDSNYVNVLKVLNFINYEYILRGNLEYVTESNSVRFKSEFNYPAKGLPISETMERIKFEIARCGYMSILFRAIDFKSDDTASSVTAARGKVREDLGMEDDIDLG
ncbi:hypothetical protein [Burkholderia ambifaria]|uniref:hypothetical protein n=1 Tax=Burkholderia ambifaria TaxID=152480 RepID=UPI0011B1D118|nr:hypothetical protein [Burkholderia ambifaria]